MDSELVLLTIHENEGAKELETYYAYIKKVEAATKHNVAKYIENGAREQIKVKVSTRTGKPAEGIIEYAQKNSFPLIVMASHGRSGIGRRSVGSVADKVVRSASSQAVMLIRAKDNRSDIRDKRLLKKTLVALDGSFSSEAVKPYISDIAFKLDMEITFLQVVVKEGQAETDAEGYLKGVCGKIEDIINVPINYRVIVGPVAENIIDLADELTFDLVAMSTRGMDRNNPLTMGSIAQKVFLGGNTPLLLIKK